MEDPDVEHQKYYSQHPMGNHDNPSPETLRFMEKQNEINEKVMDSLTGIKTDLAVIKNTVDGIHEQTKRTNGRVNKLDDCVGTYQEMWEEQMENRNDFKQKKRDLLWKILIGGAVFVFTATNFSAGINALMEIIK